MTNSTARTDHLLPYLPTEVTARFADVREAARNVVDALRDRKSEVLLIGFGTGAEIISSAVDVSDEEARHELKDQIDALAAHEGDASATNWEAALTAARGLHPDVVILVTDGFPNVHGSTVEEGPEPVAAAAAAADQLKSDGARIAAVGIDLAQGGEENLPVGSHRYRHSGRTRGPHVCGLPPPSQTWHRDRSESPGPDSRRDGRKPAHRPQSPGRVVARQPVRKPNPYSTKDHP